MEREVLERVKRKREREGVEKGRREREIDRFGDRVCMFGG